MVMHRLTGDSRIKRSGDLVIRATRRISLIIPAYNEERYLGKTLDSISEAIAAYGHPHLVEVIVVDNGSTDDTVKIAARHGARVVTEKERRIATVRNRGAAAARGTVVGFLDADSRVTPDIFNLIDDAMSSGRYIGGGTRVWLDRSSPGIFFTYCITTYPARWLLRVAGGLIFTNRKTFMAMGGFDESLYCGEDSRFIMALKRRGKREGKRFKIISRGGVTSSARSFDRHGDWYYFRNLPRIILSRGAVFRDREFTARFWYDIKR